MMTTTKAAKSLVCDVHVLVGGNEARLPAKIFPARSQLRQPYFERNPVHVHVHVLAPLPCMLVIALHTTSLCLARVALFMLLCTEYI